MLLDMSEEHSKTGRYQDAIDMLARVCMTKHPDADSNDVADAVGEAIGQSLPSTVNAIAIAIDVIDASAWPKSQMAADLFIGRYMREYRMLARRARAHGARGLDPLPREVVEMHFRPRPEDNKDADREERRILSVVASRSICIALIDEARDERSPVFESTRLVMTSGIADRMTDYIVAWLGYMIRNGHPDVLIGQRLKKALNAPKLATLSAVRAK